jgi:hypothetical protein
MLGRFGRHVRQQSVGYLALFVALGGTSYAVAANSIGSAQVRNNSLLAKDIRDNQIASGDVKSGSLTASDFKASSLPAGAPGQRGPTGPLGPEGGQGLQGPAGAAGSSRAYGEISVAAVDAPFVLQSEHSKNVVDITQGATSDPNNTYVCITLDPSIDARTAGILVSTNSRIGESVEFDTFIFVARPLAHCQASNPARTIEVITTKAPGTGASRRPFFFAVL